MGNMWMTSLPTQPLASHDDFTNRTVWTHQLLEEWSAYWSGPPCPCCRNNNIHPTRLITVSDHLRNFAHVQALGQDAEDVLECFTRDDSVLQLNIIPTLVQLVLAGCPSSWLDHLGPDHGVRDLWLRVTNLVVEINNQKLASKTLADVVLSCKDRHGLWIPTSSHQHFQTEWKIDHLPPLESECKNFRLCRFDKLRLCWTPLQPGDLFELSDLPRGFHYTLEQDRLYLAKQIQLAWSYTHCPATSVRDQQYQWASTLISKFNTHLQRLRIPVKYRPAKNMSVFLKEALFEVFKRVGSRWTGGGCVQLLPQHFTPQDLEFRFQILHADKYKEHLLTENDSLDVLPELQQALDTALNRYNAHRNDLKQQGAWSRSRGKRSVDEEDTGEQLVKK